MLHIPFLLSASPHCDILLPIMFILLIAGSLYFLSIVFFTLIGGCMPFKKTNATTETAITVLIVARNEEHRLPATLESLKHLDLNGLDAEFIFVDDASIDKTGRLMREFKSIFPVSIIRIDEKNPLLPGKKDGITRAVAVAKGSVIFMTDADCIVQPQWVKAMLPYFHGNVGLLLGHVIYKKNGIRGLTGTMEALCGTIFTFAWAGWNFSPYCRGAKQWKHYAERYLLSHGQGGIFRRIAVAQILLFPKRRLWNQAAMPAPRS